MLWFLLACTSTKAWAADYNRAVQAYKGDLAGCQEALAPHRELEDARDRRLALASADITLVQAGEGALALPILEGACPELEGRSQEQCLQWLERAR